MTNDEDRKPACPSCDAFRISRRTRGTHDAEHPSWRCSECSETFDSPSYRVPEHLSTRRPHLSEAGRAALEWEESNG